MGWVYICSQTETVFINIPHLNQDAIGVKICSQTEKGRRNKSEEQTPDKP
jgi:hypothetical protein